LAREQFGWLIGPALANSARPMQRQHRRILPWRHRQKVLRRDRLPGTLERRVGGAYFGSEKFTVDGCSKMVRGSADHIFTLSSRPRASVRAEGSAVSATGHNWPPATGN
jgi:hypothetical protein